MYLRMRANFTVGIQAAISKSKKNIAPKLYVRIKEIKRRINALELSREPCLPDKVDTISEESSSQLRVMEEVIAVDGLSKISPDQNLIKKSVNLQQTDDSSENQYETLNETDTDLNEIQNKPILDTDAIDVNETGNIIDNRNEIMNGSSRKNQENKKKTSRAVTKLKVKSQREESMLKKADDLLDKINIKVGIEGRPIEQTWARVILAEKMRIDLSRYCTSKINNDKGLENGEELVSCGELYVEYINRNYNLHRIHIE